MPVGISRIKARLHAAENQMRGGEAALHVGGAGQRRKADHVADGVNVRNGGLKMLVDVDLAAVIGHDADRSRPMSSVLPVRPLAHSRTSVLSCLPLLR